MKKSICLFIAVIKLYSGIIGQEIHERYSRINDSLRIGSNKNDFLPYNDNGYTIILPDRSKTIQGVIVSLEDNRFDLSNPKQQIYPEAYAHGLAVLYISTGIPFDFYFSKSSLHYVDTSLLNVFKKYNIPDKRIFFLGVSLAGHRALKFVEYVKAGRSMFKPDVKGVILCDSVLDWVRQWYEEKKAVKDNFAPSSVFSGKLVTYLLEKNLKGTPKSNPEAYLNFSPYSYFDGRNRHLQYFVDLNIRTYTEPATFYWMNLRRKGVFDTNFPDMVGIINELKLLGNQKNQLIVFNQEKEITDVRNPYYTWSLVDKRELINWIITMDNN